MQMANLENIFSLFYFDNDKCVEAIKNYKTVLEVLQILSRLQFARHYKILQNTISFTQIIPKIGNLLGDNYSFSFFRIVNLVRLNIFNAESTKSMK